MHERAVESIVQSAQSRTASQPKICNYEHSVDLAAELAADGGKAENHAIKKIGQGNRQMEYLGPSFPVAEQLRNSGVQSRCAVHTHVFGRRRCI